ncbi:MAG TPA: pullulanase-type alpha-1,6-glucosidase, partial [Phototrophicaceae bacterium]|nr:pullulanase-type alpha-1,6-glucosidase [Phototrophicaceae bacterium]
MTRDDVTGVWSVTGEAGWKGKYYLFEVQVYVRTTGKIETNLVTDPYSVSLSMNSKRSQLVDLRDADLKPEGWETLIKPPLNAPEDITIYELHVRDFSINDETVNPDYRGTFMAFTETQSAGMQHLIGLQQAGLSHIHLLPAFDIATIEENAAERVVPDPAELASFPPDSDQQQALIDNTRDKDGFNWGYDPYHYTVPEGSYSTNPDGTTRILEFRDMVQSLNQNGLRVVMDVVYNHTTAAGQADKSVLDKIVPDYYYRLDANGNIATSSCCPNTATEHDMMEKLMVDSLMVWATQYKVDGFRFDLMGHHMKRNIEKVRQVLDGLTLEKDGVDGKQIYLYGEGWDFGEVADNARGINATQLNMAGTGIGTFSDRLRDAVRGGNPFGGLQEQGFINGLYVDPNGITPGSEDEQLVQLLLFSDQIRVGLAGNLAAYQFIGRDDELIAGTDVPYNGNPAGYTQDPQENIIYIEAHDNETLFDIIQLKAPANTSMADRVRMQGLGLSIVTLSQGVPFYHAGMDMLRSKSIDRNSYNSGDWFNVLDFSYQENGWGRGLPPASDNQGNWEIFKPLLANPDLKPSTEDVQASVKHYEEMLSIRYSSPLFRLQTASQIQEMLSFQNTGSEQIPGLIVMTLTDTQNLDDQYGTIVV